MGRDSNEDPSQRKRETPMTATELNDMVSKWPVVARAGVHSQYTYDGDYAINFKRVPIELAVNEHVASGLAWLASQRTDNGAYLTVEMIDGGFGWEVTYKARPQVRLIGRGPDLISAIHAAVIAVKETQL